MFETLFFYPSVLRRHREGPLADERAAHLRSLAARGMARGTILRCARYCLCVAEYLNATYLCLNGALLNAGGGETRFLAFTSLATASH